MENSGGVTIEMRECTGAELKWQDGRLNRAYREYAASLSPHVRQRLKEAQRAWLQFREKECDWAGAPDEGYTLAPIIVGGCVLDMTARRADEFESHLRPGIDHRVEREVSANQAHDASNAPDRTRRDTTTA